MAALLLGCNDSSRSHPGTSIDSPAIVSASTTPAASANTPKISAALVATPWIDTKQVMDTSLDAPNFQCAPREFRTNDTITLRAEVPHGGQLLVNAPDSTAFYLIFPPRIEPGGTGLMQADIFDTTLIVRFRADLRARPFVYGRDTLEPVFRRPGAYTFVLGGDLETEDDEASGGLSAWRCTITLLPGSG